MLFGLYVGRRSHGQRADLIRRIMVVDQFIYLHGLVSGNGWKFIQKLIDADADSEEIIERLDANAGTAEDWSSILDFRMYGDNCSEVIHFRNS